MPTPAAAHPAPTAATTGVTTLLQHLAQTGLALQPRCRCRRCLARENKTGGQRRRLRLFAEMVQRAPMHLLQRAPGHIFSGGWRYGDAASLVAWA
ncbi:MAG: hypothetical protein R2911_20750 [Caldilineaceae bacterium]